MEWVYLKGSEKDFKGDSQVLMVFRNGHDNEYLCHGAPPFWAMNGLGGYQLVAERTPRIGYDLDLEFCKDNPGDPRCIECGVDEPAQKANKYQRPCKGVMIDVYDVLQAWNVTNPALQHLIKKALCPGERGHKDRQEDLQDILDSAKRAIELEKE